MGTGDLISDPGFSYIARIESASPYHNAGSSGDIGANVANRYQNGALTTIPLWPWPNEVRIKTDMCTGADATRGFCAAPSLTGYVWNYLGHGNPYAGNTPPPPPASGSSCDINGDGATNVTDVQLEVNQAIGVATCAVDLNKDGACNVIDVQRVVNAALGGPCVSP